MARWDDNLARPLPDEGGFTLIELVVALSLFVIIAAGVAEAMSQTLTITRDNRNRVVASAIAASYEESVRSEPFGSIPMGETTYACGPPPTPACLAGTESGALGDSGTTYTVVQDVTAVPGPNTTPATCSSSSSGTDASYLDVSINVTWPGVLGGAGGAGPVQSQSITSPVHTEALITPPENVIKAGTGNIAFQVNGASSNPLQGVPITLSGTALPTPKTVRTTASGCAYFAFMPPGVYSVSSPGYIDTAQQQIDTAHSPHQTVNAGKTLLVNEVWDLAASVTLTYAPGALQPSTSFPLSVRALAAAAPYRPGVAPGTTFHLFPYPSGYSIWGGDCSLSEPAGSAVQIITPPPGGTVTATIRMPTATIVSDSAPFSTVTITHAADNQCQVPESYSYNTGANSRSANISIPFGNWLVQPEGQSVLPVAITSTTNNPSHWP